MDEKIEKSQGNRDEADSPNSIENEQPIEEGMKSNPELYEQIEQKENINQEISPEINSPKIKRKKLRHEEEEENLDQNLIQERNNYSESNVNNNLNEENESKYRDKEGLNEDIEINDGNPIQDENNNDDNNEVFSDNEIIKEKAKKGKKRTQKEVAKEQYEKKVTEDVRKLIKAMTKAYKEDKANYEQKKSAILKLQLLPRVEKMLLNPTYQRIFMGHPFFGLNIINHWISKYEDGKFPLKDILKRILLILKSLPVSLDDLTNSNIGKSVVNICLEKSNDNELRKLAKEITDKWQAIIFELPTDFKQGPQENGKYIAFREEMKRQMKKSQEYMTKKRIIPEKSSLDFVKNIKATDDTVGQNRLTKIQQEETKSVKRVLIAKAKESKKNTKPKMSLEGKDLHY